jgi:hypothetical protein
MDDSMDRLINKGWEQMNKTLDKEMPFRRIYFSIKNKYMYSIAVVLFLITFTFVFFNNDGVIIQSENNKLANNFRKIYNNNHEIIKGQTSLNTPFDLDNSSNYIKDELISSKKNETTRNDKLNVEKIKILSAEVNFNRDNREICSNNLKSDNNGIKKLDASIKEYPLAKKIKHNNLSFSLNSINKDFSSVDGIDGAFNYTYAISDKIGISTGIEHTLLSEEINTDEEKFFYSYYNNDINDGSEDYVFVKPGSVNNKMYYLGIPVSLSYKFHKLAFSVGFKVSYLLNEKYPEMPDFGENFAEFSIIVLDNQKYKSENEKFDYSLIFKLEYMVKKDISIFSKFNYSLKDVFSSPEKSKYDPYYPVAQSRNVNLNAKPKDYYFGFGIKYDLMTK